MGKRAKYGILLVNTGTVASPHPRDVRKFLVRYLSSRRICPGWYPLWWLLVRLVIAPARAGKSAKKYEAIWTSEGSPLTRGLENIEFALERALRAEGCASFLLRCASNMGEPDLQKALAEMKASGCEELVVLPLFPQSAYSTTGDVYDKFKAALDKLNWAPRYRFIENYHDNPSYTRAVAASIERAGFQANADDKIFFSYHSIPLRDIEAGDDYELQVGASSLLIAKNLGLERTQWSIVYQSRFNDGRRWLSPFAKDALDRHVESGSGRLFMVCPGFSLDCLETLYDIKDELAAHYRNTVENFAANKAARTGAHNQRLHATRSFIYVPCLGASKAQIRVMKDILLPYLEVGK